MKSEIETDQIQNQEKVYRDGNLQIIFAVTLTAIMGVSSITPAFPKIVQGLNISPKEIGLLITVFTLPGVFLTLVLGVLADRIGRKKILVPSLLLFGTAGGACTFARDFNLLLLLRFFQGIGAASLGSLNITIIGDLYSGKQRTTAMGYNASVLSIGTASYPVVGGALATLGWFYPFLLPLIAIPVGLLVLFSLKNPEPKTDQNLLSYLMDAFQSVKNQQVIALFIASIVMFIILYGSFLTYYPFLIGKSFGAQPFVIGIIISSMSITTAITSSQLGKLAKRYQEKTLLKIAYFLYALALVMVPFVPNLWILFIPTLIFGIGHGILVPMIQTLLAGFAPIDQRAAIMSLNGMVLRIGQTLGPLIIGVAYSLWGIGGTFLLGASLAISMLIVVMLMIK
jgi:ACDE family multidrug resistance protein